MAQSEAEICNQALVHVGQTAFIASLDTDTSVAGRILQKVYQPARDKVLESYPWPFATKHVTLSLLSTTRTGWAYMYQKPTDCLYVRYVSNGSRPGGPLYPSVMSYDYAISNSLPLPVYAFTRQVPYAIEASDDLQSSVLLTDLQSAELVYTAKMTAVATFDPTFVEALSLFLAMKLASSLLRKPDLAKDLYALYKAELVSAAALAYRAQGTDVEPDAPSITVRGW